jgi:hypothetical protein
LVNPTDVREPLRRLDRYVTAHDYGGPDPYDALSSPLGRYLTRPRPRQAVVQLVRRSPVNLRPVLGVRPVRMAKALALFAAGLRDAPFLPDAPGRAAALVDELDGRRHRGAWGYEFDVQTRWGFYRAGSPNIVVTAFVVEALAQLGRLRSDDPALAWIVDEMVTAAGHIRYAPGIDVLIHNANLLGARALQRLSPGHPAVARALQATVSAQRPDGLWSYGEAPGLQWVDNFHTVYVLWALRDLSQVTSTTPSALARGVDAWAGRCFGPDGAIYYLAEQRGRLDVHNVATALHGLASFPAHERCAQLLPFALHQALRLQGADGAFRARPAEPPYMRWNQAHMFRALAFLQTHFPIGS